MRSRTEQIMLNLNADIDHILEEMRVPRRDALHSEKHVNTRKKLAKELRGLDYNVRQIARAMMRSRSVIEHYLK